jgi:fatty acid desaturase
MSQREDETWKIIGAFVIVCALLTALIVALWSGWSTQALHLLRKGSWTVVHLLSHGSLNFGGENGEARSA